MDGSTWATRGVSILGPGVSGSLPGVHQIIDRWINRKAQGLKERGRYVTYLLSSHVLAPLPPLDSSDSDQVRSLEFSLFRIRCLRCLCADSL